MSPSSATAINDVLTTDLLNQIFSWLPPKDLMRAPEVCKYWHTAFKTHHSIQHFCRRVLDDAIPYQNSWDKRYQILRNWNKGCAKVVELSLSSTAGFYDHHQMFSILEDNTVIQLCPSRQSPLPAFLVRNVVTGEEIRKINLSDGCRGGLGLTELAGEFLTVFDFDPQVGWGRLCRCNIRTGEWLQPSPEAAIPTMMPIVGVMRRSAHEIVVGLGRHDGTHLLLIWDTLTGTLQQTESLPVQLHGRGLGVTPHYIILLCKCGEVMALNRKTLQIHRIGATAMHCHGEEHLNRLIDSSGFYCAYLGEKGQVHVLEETARGLAEVRTLSIGTIDPGLSSLSALRIYRNWLCVTRNDTFYVWNIANGNKIAEIHGERDGVRFGDFYTNAEQLFIQIQKGQAAAGGYICYDFRHTATQVLWPWGSFNCAIQ